jgi:kinetochore protein NNF1
MLTRRNVSQTEYATILRDRGVVPALNDLDTLIAEAYTRKSLSPPSASSATTQAQAQAQSRRAKLSPPPPPAPHTLLPSTIAQAHLLPFLTQQRSLLNARIQTVGAKNEKLADEVRVQREEIERLVGGLEAVVRDLDGANEVLAEGAQGLREESRAVEKDIKSG